MVNKKINTNRKNGMLVPPKSNQDILNLALGVRRHLNYENIEKFPIGELIDRKLDKIIPGATFCVNSKEDMGPDEGRVPFGDTILILREDIYEKLMKDDPRARFTACHELGHLIMHRNVQLNFARSHKGEIAYYENSEWQADSFASYLLYPPYIAKKIPYVSEAMTFCGISFTAHKVAIEKYTRLKWL